MAENTPSTVSAGAGPAPDKEVKITSHLLLSELDSEKRGLDLLHQDLFDSDPEVVVSALAAVAKIGDPRSLQLIVRLTKRKEVAIRSAVAEAIGRIRHPSSVKLLFQLFRISQNEEVKCAVLEALAVAAPKNQEVVALIERQVGSNLVSESTRRRSRILLSRLGYSSRIAGGLLGAGEDVLLELCRVAPEDQSLEFSLLEEGRIGYERLSGRVRSALIPLAARCATPSSPELLLLGLDDIDAGVRKAAYESIASDPAQRPHAAVLLERLLNKDEPVATLEDEIASIYLRMEAMIGDGGLETAGLGSRISALISSLFAEVSKGGASIGHEDTELGWLMKRASEYLEFYADEDFRTTLIRFLKVGGPMTSEEMLERLRATAVRVEVRHFEGYRALAEILKNPRRPGTALIVRALSIAKLGKSVPFYRLIRALRTARVISSSGAVAQIRGIFEWARDARLYRLAEAAMFALSRIDADATTAICRECLALPLTSKILAIGAIRLLGEVSWESVGPAVSALLRGHEDNHVILNLIDALSNLDLPDTDSVLEDAVVLVRTGRDRDVVHAASCLVAERGSAGATEAIATEMASLEPWRQRIMLEIIGRRAAKGELSDPEGVSEALYSILRAGPEEIQGYAAALLWRLGDDYALTVLPEFLKKGTVVQKLDVIRGLEGALAPEIVRLLKGVLLDEGAPLQEALRTTFFGPPDEPTRQEICRVLIAARRQDGLEGDSDAPNSDAEVNVDLHTERTAYRFEREFIQEVAILFTDIQGYSRKAQFLSSLELSTLVQDYENLLLPLMGDHGGELIKRMGDGHLFVFGSPLNATLAGLRVQKALRRFNSYREENLRVTVRVGVHWGKVVRRNGDVLGNHVNIASRLESSAKGGSALVSKSVYERLDGHVHCREIGEITVKNISEPIEVYEPYEISLDFPAALDPLKSSHPASAPEPERPASSSAGIGEIEASFSHLSEAILSAAQQGASADLIRSAIEDGYRTVEAALRELP